LGGEATMGAPMERSETVPRLLRWSSLLAVVVAISAAIAAYLSEILHVRVLSVVSAALAATLAVLLIYRLRILTNALIRARGALIESECRSAAAIMASSIAHDINNILLVCGGHIDELARCAGNPGLISKLSVDFRRAATEIAVLAKQLLRLGRPVLPGQFESVELSTAIEASLNVVRGHRAVKACHLEVQPLPRAEVRLNQALLSRALINLIVNAAEATGEGGRIAVRCRPSAANIEIEVHDDGPGIAPQDRELILSPFYTSKADGSGLGLVVVKECAREHSGQLEVSDSDLGGACLRLRIQAQSSR
jgi:two-component system sensor histidine kinase HydH